MINITRRGQWQLTRIIRGGCVLRRIAIRPNRGAKIAIDPNNAEGLGFVLRRIAIRPNGGRKDCH